MNIDFLKIEKETEEEFKLIADKLLNDCAVENQESIYRLIDIEFYWTSPKHKDDSTYQRKHIDPNHGDWFFHYSGVDIALKNEKIGGFGGILIRGIYSLKEKKIYNGPMVCAMKLFSGTSAFGGSINTKILEYKFNRKQIENKLRVNLGQNAVECGTHNLNYRFTINPND